MEPKELYRPLIEQEQARTPESRIDANTFVDDTSGRLFRHYRYFDYNVIQDVETGRINAGSFVRNISKLSGKKKDLDMFKRTSDYEIAIELTEELMKNDRQFMTPGNPGGFTRSEIEAYMLRIYNEGCSDSVKGTYVPIPIFQLIALWADKRHKVAVLVLLASINENANMKAISAYEEIKRLNDKLIEETTELKAKIKESEEIVRMKEQLIDKITKPINRLASPEAIYARNLGPLYFQLRKQKQPITDETAPDDCFRYINVFNSEDVLKVVSKILKQQGLFVQGPKRSRAIPREHLDFVFELVEKTSKNEPIEIPIDIAKPRFLNHEIARLRNCSPTPQVLGLIYEREYELEHEKLVPWEVIPQRLINKYNETYRDNGFDAVVLSEDEEGFIEVYQIKHHANTELRREEVARFLAKCRENRYADIQKHLILHHCTVGPSLTQEFEELGVIVEFINE